MRKGLVHILAVISMFFWGISYIWSKIVFEVYSPLTTIFLRLLVSTAFLFLFVYLTGKVEHIQKEDRWMMLLSAFFNPFLYFIGENYGLSLVSASLSAIIVATIPVFVPFAAYYFFKEKIQPVNITGLIISFAGLFLIVFSGNFELSANPKGLAFLFLAVTSAIFYSITLKSLTNKYKPLTIITWQNLIGAIFLLPFFLYFDGKSFFKIVPHTATIVNLILLGIFASSVAFVLFAYIVKHLGVIKSSLYTNIIPVFTAIFSFYFLDEHFSLRKIIGILIVIAGVILSEIRKIRFIYKSKKLSHEN
ncbi:MAG: DMT family transporter [Bacteroidales bacterium]|nr:DMT family transporter [Bacteroidales bacterium]